MKDRTLDQMCTVTKPGLSFISAAYAAELYISLLHHPLGHHAPANEDENKLPTTDLGKLPHHLRGNLGDFETSIFYGRAFDQCVACSKFILDCYNTERDGFMLRVLNDPSFIHEVTGLKKELEEYEKMENGIVEILDDEFEFITDSTSSAGPKIESTAATAVKAP
jgi:ubiquitin-like modifier-activating enzyme ATG7